VSAVLYSTTHVALYCTVLYSNEMYYIALYSNAFHCMIEMMCAHSYAYISLSACVELSLLLYLLSVNHLIASNGPIGTIFWYPRTQFWNLVRDSKYDTHSPLHW
jgi:hypothetical protein